jgi:hypothetical protein
MSNTLVDDLLEVFPTKHAPIHVTDEIVRKKYRSLRVDMFMFIVEMTRTSDPEVLFNLIQLK